MARAPLGLRHQKVQRLRRLVARRSARQAERVFVIEGAKVVEEAAAAGAPIEAVYVAAGATAPVLALADRTGARVHELAPGVMEQVADTVTPQAILAVAPYVDRPLDEALEGATMVVVCIDVRDPGNAGTVLRSAGAAGADAVVCCDGSVDVYNPKTVRASAGALFHVPVVSGGEPEETLERVGHHGLRRLATVARGGEPYDRVDLARPVAFVLGNEASGLPEPLLGCVDGQVTIPMSGRAESLNVGMAAAVLCFEAARQRRGGQAS